MFKWILSHQIVIKLHHNASKSKTYRAFKYIKKKKKTKEIYKNLSVFRFFELNFTRGVGIILIKLRIFAAKIGATPGFLTASAVFGLFLTNGAAPDGFS